MAKAEFDGPHGEQLVSDKLKAAAAGADASVPPKEDETAESLTDSEEDLSKS